MQPGSVANRDFVRVDEDAVRFTRAVFEAGKPVAEICHGPWMLAGADRRGRHDEQALQTAAAGGNR